MKLEWRDYKLLKWGPRAAVIGTLGIFFSAQVIAAVLIFVPLLIAGWSDDQISNWLDKGGISTFITSIIVAGSALGLLYVFLKSRRAKLQDLGLVKPKVSDLGYVITGAIVYFILYIGIVSVISQIFDSLDLNQQQELGYNTETTGIALVLAFVSLVILPPLVEEILTRGFLFSGLRKAMKFIPAAIICSAIFGLAHLGGGEGGSAIWIATIDTFILGVVLAYLRERSGSLWPSIGLHASKNLLAFLFLFVFKIT
jgi:membrane protease YdiL (CAAX protease family)